MTYDMYLENLVKSGVVNLFTKLDEFMECFSDLNVVEAIDIIGDWVEAHKTTKQK